MDVFDMIIALLSGVALFLFGMSLMGDGLTSVAGDNLETYLYRMTNTPVKGLLLGTAVASLIQSSAATSVMVVGFVNSGMMKLTQAIAITLGANVGTSITGWILCLSYVGSSGVASLLSSATISGIAVIAATLLRMFAKRSVHKNIGNILMGFAILMFGMQMMSSAVSPLRDSPVFVNAMTMFSNPVPGILLGTGMTVILQSASAGIGVLQAVSVTGALSFATIFPITLGIGIGASFPVLLSSMGASKDGKRAAVSYLAENVLGMLICGALFYSLNAAVHFSFMDTAANPVIIALVNSLYRILTAILLFPFLGKIEHLLNVLIKDSPEDMEDKEDTKDFDLLEERLLPLPALALGQCDRVIDGMAKKVRKNVGRSLNLILNYDDNKYEKVQKKEALIDKYESRVGDYLMKLTKEEMNSSQTREVTLYMRLIGDLERLDDYASNIARLTNEAHEQNLVVSEETRRDLNVVIEAMREEVNSTIRSYRQHDLETAKKIKPYSAALNFLCEILQARHLGRLSRGECDKTEAALFNDLMSTFEHITTHCIAISGVVRREYQSQIDFHMRSAVRDELTEEEYQELYDGFLSRYDVVSGAERPISVEAETVE